MAAAGRIRRASLDALAEIEPEQLANQLQIIVREASMVPGVVTLLTAESLSDRTLDHDALERGVGVQLCYEGLRLTRELIQEDGRYHGEDATNGYLELVGAEVLVSRGFANLARTNVAPQTIEIVRRFSRNQTLAHEGIPSDDADAKRTLEYDVVSLAVDAGADLVYDSIPAAVTELGRQFATQFDVSPLPPANGVTTTIRNELAAAPPADTVTAND